MKDKNDLNQEIIAVIAQDPAGLSSSTIQNMLGLSINHRTLLRRLETLLEQGKIIRQGQGKNTRYKITDVTDSDQATLNLTPASIAIQQQVNLPLKNKTPVGYQLPFLESYIPNESYYLSRSEREYLDSLNQENHHDQPAGTYARKILDRFLIDLAQNSSRLEGNTYSLLETEQLLFKHQTIKEKSAVETQMIINHKNAIEFLVDSSDDINFNTYTICNLHALLADNLLKNPKAYGRVRNIAVGIGNSVYQPLDIPQLLQDYLEKVLLKASAINNPFEQSFFIMVQLPYLQPFEDVNKRVSRLSANIPFIKYNYCPISFVDVPTRTYIEGLLGVYEFNKIDLLKEVYLWSYERSIFRYAKIRHTLGEPDKFRMQYREEIYNLVQKIITQTQGKKQAIKIIQDFAKENIAHGDTERFIDVIETELLALHAGNFARYKVTPSQFAQWENEWE